MTFKELHNRVKNITDEWYLRMESDSFLILVNKENNKYVNVYKDQFPKGMLPILANAMEKHPGIKSEGNMRKCECGAEVEYDGYDSIEIEEGFLIIKGDAMCPNCQKEYAYIESHRCDFNNPFEVELEENNG